LEENRIKTILIISLIVLVQMTCRAADIESLADLKTVAGAPATYDNVTIKPGTYTLDADITFSDNVLTVTHDGTAGDVIIDCIDTYTFRISNRTGYASNNTWSGIDTDHRIVWTQGNDDTLVLDCNSTGLNVTFNYCDFKEADVGNGATMFDAVFGGTHTFIFNNCRAFNNRNDGFSISGTAYGTTLDGTFDGAFEVGEEATGQTSGAVATVAVVTAWWITVQVTNSIDFQDGEQVLGDVIGDLRAAGMTEDLGYVVFELNDCEAYNNDPTGGGGAAGDGYTQHASNQTGVITGGSFYNNGKSGICIVDGSLTVTDATFYGNGGTVTTNADLFIDTDSSPFVGVYGCTFKWLDTVNKTKRHIACQDSGLTHVVVENCVFKEPNSLSAAMIGAITFNGDMTLELRGNVFSGFCQSGEYVIFTGANYENSILVAVNNTFYDSHNVIHPKTNKCMIVGNIFSEVDGTAIYDDALDYDDNALNGYNCFHNCNMNSRGGDKSTDINADPLLFDPANDDMRLKSKSPCLNAGPRTVNDGYADIGAWQRKSFIRFGWW